MQSCWLFVVVFLVVVGQLGGPRQTTVQGGSVLCAYCQIAIYEAEQVLAGGNLTAAEVEAVLLPYCKSPKLTIAQRAKCTAGVKVAAPVLLDDLQSDENPLAFCGRLTLCDVTQSALCRSCQASVKGLEVELHRNPNITDQDVIDTFLPYCAQLSDPVEQDACRAGLELGGVDLLGQLRDGVNPINFCGQFYICNISHTFPPKQAASAHRQEQVEFLGDTKKQPVLIQD